MEGTLREGYTGRPIDSGEVVLSGLRGAERVFVASGKPDAGGRFRFERVVRNPKLGMPDTFTLGWKPPQGNLVFADPGPAWSHYVYVELKKARGGSLDLGTRFVWLESTAREAFASVCRTGQRVPAVPGGTPVVVFQTAGGKEPMPAPQWHKEIASAWPEGWKGVLCIEQRETKVGTYGYVGLGMAAMKVTWDATVVRLPDGTVYRTTVAADPPLYIQEDLDTGKLNRPPAGNPMPKLQEWLKGLASSVR